MVVARIWAMKASGDEIGARKELDRRLAVSRIPELVFQDAALKLAGKDYPGAQLGATELLKQNPTDIRALRVLMDSYAGQKKEAEAERSIRAAASLQPKSAAIQQLLGEWLRRRGPCTRPGKHSPGREGSGFPIPERESCPGGSGLCRRQSRCCPPDSVRGVIRG